MSDNQNDEYLSEEYHFAEEPDMNLDDAPIEKKAATSHEKVESSTPRFPLDADKIKAFFNENSPARNAVVIVGILLALLIVYKVIASVFFHEKSGKTTTTVVTKQIQSAPKVQPITPVAPVTSAVSSSEMDSLKSKLQSMEQTESTLQSQVSSLNNQLVSVNTNLNTLAEKLVQLNQQLTDMRRMVQEQADHILILKEQTKKSAKTTKRIYPHRPAVVYYLKAVIPGRAWLMTNAGSTMTVRVGTPIPGYGVVRFIDAIQGRVLTSSGQLIRFSQDDS